MNRVTAIILIFFLHFLSQAQLTKVQYSLHNEENSSIGSSVTYNWSQLSNGEVFVSGNSGIERFDGKEFYPLNAEGRGRAISSSIEAPDGTLWCNSFQGDIYYLENQQLVRHEISDSINELTTFHRIKSRFFLRTEETLFEIDYRTKKVSEIAKFGLIRTLFEYHGEIFLIVNQNEESLGVQNLSSGELSPIKIPELMESGCRFLKGKSNYLFFEEARKLITLNDFMKGNYSRFISIDHPEKINYSCLTNNQLSICSAEGIRFFSLNGQEQNAILENFKVSHFGVDAEGNYLATTVGAGLIVIPNLTTSSYSYDAYLKNEQVIKSISNGGLLIHGTNGGNLIIHDLKRNTVQKLYLGAKSDVYSMTLMEDPSKLLVYCDALYEVDLNSVSILKKTEMTSLKTILRVGEDHFFGTRKSIIRFRSGERQDETDIGWIFSMVHIPQKSEILISSKSGLYSYDLINHSVSKVDEKRIPQRKTIHSLQRIGTDIYCVYNLDQVLKFDINKNNAEVIYQHPEQNLMGIDIIDQSLALFAKDTVYFMNGAGEVKSKLTVLQGMNESRTRSGFSIDHSIYLTHSNSLTILKSIPEVNKAVPSLAYNLLPNSSFNEENGRLLSEFKGNILSLRLRIRNGIRAKGSIKAYYKLEGNNGDWLQIENPYGEINIERLPIGEGAVLLKAVNEEGKVSSILKIPFKVAPPFYLATWFIILEIIVVILIMFGITRWRVAVTRRKSIERLRKKQLEARTLNAELTAIRSQMNPHFIFNVLTAIQAKVIQGKADEAYQNIGDFAELIRNVLEKSGKEFISFEDELALMENYVELENSRLEQPISFEIELQDPEYFEDVQLPTLITQPVIENAIKHAFPTGVDEKKIRFIASRFPGGFKITITDNGVGLEATARDSDKSHDSFALKALRKRINSLSEKASYSVAVDVHSSERGTEVKFTFTYK